MISVFIILPCFNEELVLPHFYESLKAELNQLQGHSFFAIWVDDGSFDKTWEVIQVLRDSEHLKNLGVRFVRNFGHQAAIQAGCEFVANHPEFSPHSRVLILDSDGQHPVSEIPTLLRDLEHHRHVQMIRTETLGVGPAKQLSSTLFYKIFRSFTGLELPDGAADYRGLQGAALLNYLKYQESGRFNRGLFHLAEPPKLLAYEARAREHGTSKYSLSKMFKLAFIGITSFSNRPLILAAFTATAFGFLVCIGYFLFEFLRYLNGRVFQPGWFTVMAWISMWGMILSFCILLLSVYVGRIFDEAKKRPIYLVRETK